MKQVFYLFIILLFLSGSNSSAQNAIIANHSTAKLSLIPDEWIDSAKVKLHIAYGHTSHGSQLITGMQGLENWKGNKFGFNEGGTNGELDLDDYAFSGASDLGNPDRTSWAAATRNYLNSSSHSDVNVVIWSWCGQVSSATESDINTYLNLMTALENDYPHVKFVYMTGHLDGSGVNGNLNQRNEQIRNYCTANGKILFDFADIESYDPDGNYFLNKAANDNCDYDSDGNGSRDKNWAIDWQNSHTENVDWYNCSAAHSIALNGNLKAYAAWWLWAKLAGWDSVAGIDLPNKIITEGFHLYQNYPNPFNPTTKIRFSVPNVILQEFQDDNDVTHSSSNNGQIISLKVYDILGNQVATLVNEFIPAGNYEVEFNSSKLINVVPGKSGYPSGVYFYQLKAGNYCHTKSMILLK
ncbi:MAG: T9SS type A sorting domain-containing protein [Ignavibacteriaceae bacterium]|nr:T9SS type A sorting domain-containing protein [Ignavibacteriaceae bacterium]